MNVNKVILVGRLTRDPEVRSTQTGQTVTSISLATGRTYTDKSGQKQEQTEFHNLVLWGRLGEIAGQYLVKGQECYFEGRLQTRTYTGKDNVERRTTEINVENMQMGSKPQGAGNSSYQRPQNQNTAPPPQQNTQQNNSQQNQPKEEEIPTINLDDEKDDIKLEDVPF
jgi:single-strand DNA-binding protein